MMAVNISGFTSLGDILAKGSSILPYVICHIMGYMTHGIYWAAYMKLTWNLDQTPTVLRIRFLEHYVSLWSDLSKISGFQVYRWSYVDASTQWDRIEKKWLVRPMGRLCSQPKVGWRPTLYLAEGRLYSRPKADLIVGWKPTLKSAFLILCFHVDFCLISQLFFNSAVLYRMWCVVFVFAMSLFWI